MVCRNCGTNNPEHALKCVRCGAHLQMPGNMQQQQGNILAKVERKALLALVFGIVSVCFDPSIIGVFISIGMGICAIIFGCQSKKMLYGQQGIKKDMATIGFIFGIVGCSLGVINGIINIISLVKETTDKVFGIGKLFF